MALERAESRNEAQPKNFGSCPVCLQPFEDKVVLNNCFHAFCRVCILQWSEFEPAQRHGRNRCPLCRTHFSALYSNYSDSTSSYDVYCMDDDKKAPHWSSTLAHEAAVSQQKFARQQMALVRSRRLFIYAARLIPIVTWMKASTGTEQALKSLKRRFETKSPLFLARELPILLLHDHMDLGLESQQKQEREVALLQDLVSHTLFFAISPLVSFIAAYAQPLPNFAPHDVDSSLLLSVTSDPQQKSAIDDLRETLEPFFEENTLLLIRELALFVLSPYTTLAQFDEGMKYRDIVDDSDHDH